MSDQPNDDEAEPFRTVCFTCHGSGRVTRPKMAILGGRSASVLTHEPCPDCPKDPEMIGEGTGFLSGFQQPV